MKLFTAIFATAAISVTTSSGANASVITDTDFILSDWATSTLLNGSGHSFGPGQSLTNGNPGAHRTLRQTVFGAGQYIVGSRLTAVNHDYDPGTMGAFDTLGFDLDAIIYLTSGISGGAANANVYYSALVYQASSWYIADLGWVSENWAPLTNHNVTASDFTLLLGGGPASLDFSASGGVMQFGYASTFYATGLGQIVYTGADNFRVETNLVPIPAAGWLFMTALLGLVGKKRLSPRC